MHVQPRYNPLAKSDFYADQRAARPLVEGTVARGQLNADTYFYTGKIGKQRRRRTCPSRSPTKFLTRGQRALQHLLRPVPLADRRRQRLDSRRAASPSKPPSYHIERLRKAPIGYFFDVMTNGFGIMPDYSAQVPPRDRWGIAAYIRALAVEPERNHGRRPAGQSIPSKAPEFVEPGCGATLPQVVPMKSGKGETE